MKERKGYGLERWRGHRELRTLTGYHSMIMGILKGIVE